MSSASLLCLDFDGVICDSVLECLVSSWVAYHGDNGQDRVSMDSLSVALRASFTALRPFIRSGEDYVLIQDLLAREQTVKHQAEFDRNIAAAGFSKMAEYKQRFYAARESLLATRRDYWFSLNRLYPHMAILLARYSALANMHIVSTKRSDFILEILRHNGIEYDASRVHYAAIAPKLEIVGRLINSLRAGGAIFVDDQIDHLVGSRHPAIEPRLASWGYVKDEWLSDSKGVLVVNPGEMEGIFAQLAIGSN